MNHATAKVSCFARAYHQRNNRAPVFADSAAFPLPGDDYGQISESMAQGIGFFLPGFSGSREEGLRLIVDRFLSPSVLGRSAYCESALKNEVRIGCGQYVLFASGYDTYAARNPDTALPVFELDLPDMIADKRRRVERAGLSSKAAYVPCDLSEDGSAVLLRLQPRKSRASDERARRGMLCAGCSERGGLSMSEMKINAIGIIENRDGDVRVRLEKRYAAGLTGLEGYGHVQILWWADGCDNERDRGTLTESKPYKKGPETLGVFALRSPERPNPIAVSNAEISYVDAENGVVGLYYVDAFDGTKVLDLKPYTPSIDRIETPTTPAWCAHWPKSYEESGRFDWEAEFNF